MGKKRITTNCFVIKPLLCTDLLGFKLQKSIFDAVPNIWILEFNNFGFDILKQPTIFMMTGIPIAREKTLIFTV